MLLTQLCSVVKKCDTQTSMPEVDWDSWTVLVFHLDETYAVCLNICLASKNFALCSLEFSFGIKVYRMWCHNLHNIFLRQTIYK
jgi:hypothetical protein